METSNYTWIDAPVIDVIEYFAGTAGYFLNAAVVLGSLIAVLAILWNSIQLIFGTLEVQKFIIGIISKFAFFILILNLYPVMTAGLRHFAIGLGTEASGKPVTKLTAELTAFLKQMEEIVEQEDAGLNAELAAAIAAQSRIREEGTTWKDWGSSIGFALLGIYRPLDYDITQADARVTQAQKLIEERLKHPSDNMKTVMAIKTVLKPVDETGEPMEGNLGSAYRLDLSLKTKDSQDTGYLSPNSLLRAALLSAQIMWEKEWSSVVTEWEENDDKGFFTSMTKSLSFSKFPVARLFDMVLVFCCQIAIVLTMIFSLVQYVMCILEFTITAAFAVVLIPCLLFDGLKDIANKVLPSMLAQAVKLTMITMCMFFAMYAYLSMAMNTIGEGTSFNLATFAYVMFIIVITFALTQSAPKIAVTLLTGQPQLSMGELVAAMGTAAAAGGAAAHAAGMTAGAVQKAAPAAARMAADRIGDAAAIAGAGRTASGAMAAAGGSKGEQGFAGLKAMGSEAMYRTGQRFKSALHGAAHSGMKGDSMGGPVGGGSGAGSNRFHGEKGGHLDPGSDMRYGMASNIDKDGNKTAMTAGEYWKAQAADAAARHSAVPTPRTHAKYAGMKAQSSYTGALPYNPPLMLPPPPPAAKELPQPSTIYL